MEVVVVGGGSWGTALAKVLVENGHNVVVWTNSEKVVTEVTNEHTNNAYLPNVRLPENLKFTLDIEVVKNAELIVSALPSKVTVDVLKKNKQHFNEKQIVVNVAKGFEPAQKTRLSVAIGNVLPSKVCVLSGPSHAEEVAGLLPTVLTASSEDELVAKTVQEVFSNSYIRVYTNTDVVGVELGGATKNIIAVATGILDGLGYGDNTKAALMTRGMYEITKLGLALGAKVNTFYGLTGMGDLIVTCGSMHSRNRRAGILIGEGKTLDEAVSSIGMVVEGVEAVKIVHAIAKEKNIEMPVTEALYSVLFENKKPKEVLLDLMNRDMKSEDIFK